MKKLIVVVVMLSGFFSAAAQTKIGYINTDELIGLMPEAAKVDSQLREYQQSLQLQGQALQTDAEKKRNDYYKDSATLSASMKEIRMEELVKLYARLQNYDQEAQEKASRYAQDKIGPVREKAMDAIKTVAKEKGYSYVIDQSTNALLVAPPGDDLLPAVKTKLGIKDPVPAKPAGAKN